MGAVKDAVTGPYEVQEGSITSESNCSVVDTRTPIEPDEVCACWDKDTAQMVCDALNLYHKVNVTKDFRVISGG